MRTKTVTENEVLYDQDFYAWTVKTAQLIRAGRLEGLKLEVLAEEVEDMGKRDYREAKSKLNVLLHYLLKWEYQPDRRSSSWRSTIREQQDELKDLFKDSPSLKVKIIRDMEDVYRRAVDRAVDETGLSADTFPHECPFTVEVIDLDLRHVTGH